MKWLIAFLWAISILATAQLAIYETKQRHCPECSQIEGSFNKAETACNSAAEERKKLQYYYIASENRINEWLAECK